MSRFRPEDIGLPDFVRVDKRDSVVVLKEFNVRLPRKDHICEKCGRPMISYGTYVKTMHHYFFDVAYTLHVIMPRSYCRRCKDSKSVDIPFVSRVCPSCTYDLEEKAIAWIRDGWSILRAAKTANVSYGTIRKLIDGVHVREVHLSSKLLMDEIHAYTWREDDGREYRVYWSCAYDGDTGCLIDIFEGRGQDEVDAWYESFNLRERNRVRFFCSDMHRPYMSAAGRYLKRAIKGVDKFHVAKAGCQALTDARCQIQKNACNADRIKHMRYKLIANRCRMHKRKPPLAVNIDKANLRDVLCVCDTKHSHLRISYLALQLYYAWQDAPWGDIEEMEYALDNLIGRLAILPIAKMRSFAGTLSPHKKLIIDGYYHHINTAKAEAMNRKLNDVKRNTRGLRDIGLGRKRYLIAYGPIDAIESGTAYAIRKEANIEQKRSHKR